MNRSSLNWALEGAVRFSVATAVLALVLSIVLPDTGAERFATTAYLAAIFAVIALTAKRFVGDDERQTAATPRRSWILGALGFAFALALLLPVVSAYVTDLTAELVLISYCAIAIVFAAFARAGALRWIHDRLVAGQRLAATASYKAAIAATVLLLAALLPKAFAQFAAVVGFGIVAAACLLIAWTLVAPTPLGDVIRRVGAETRDIVVQLSSDLVFARLLDASIVALVCSITMASLLRRPYSEPFATVAYISAIFAAFGLTMECRRWMAEPSTAPVAAAPPPSSDRLTAESLEQLARALTLESVIRYSAAAMIAAFAIAAPLLRRHGEPFAVLGYCAAVVLTIGVGLECRQAIVKRSAP